MEKEIGKTVSILKPILVEGARWAILIAVGAFVKFLVEALLVVEQTPGIAIFGIILRFIDAGLHKSGIAVKGITRF